MSDQHAQRGPCGIADERARIERNGSGLELRERLRQTMGGLGEIDEERHDQEKGEHVPTARHEAVAQDGDRNWELETHPAKCARTRWRLAPCHAPGRREASNESRAPCGKAVNRGGGPPARRRRIRRLIHPTRDGSSNSPNAPPPDPGRGLSTITMTVGFADCEPAVRTFPVPVVTSANPRDRQLSWNRNSAEWSCTPTVIEASVGVDVSLRAAGTTSAHGGRSY
jgi:hypothetical protein